MKIKILKSTVCGGKAVKAGSVVEASASDANFLINKGRAEVAKEAPNPKAKAKSSISTDELTKR